MGPPGQGDYGSESNKLHRQRDLWPHHIRFYKRLQRANAQRLIAFGAKAQINTQFARLEARGGGPWSGAWWRWCVELEAGPCWEVGPLGRIEVTGRGATSRTRGAPPSLSALYRIKP